MEPPPGALPRNANPRLPIGSARSPAPRAVARPILSCPMGLARSDIHTWEPCTQLSMGWTYSVRPSRSGRSYYGYLVPEGARFELLFFHFSSPPSPAILSYAVFFFKHTPITLLPSPPLHVHSHLRHLFCSPPLVSDCFTPPI